MIRKTPGGRYYVASKTGKRLSKATTKAKLKKRLRTKNK